MILQRAELHNFRSYYGMHVLDLEPIDGNGLVVIFGENMTGKTGLLLALTWCLYGRAYGRRGETIPTYLPGERENNYLINARAVDEEDYLLRVQLQWEHEGATWVLTRQEQCNGNPLLGDRFEPWSNLMIDGEVRSRQQIEQQINQVIHHQAAQFYFFDGELLSQYEKWLESATEREERVKRAIEITVGVAALRLDTEMERVARDAAEEQRKLVRREQREERLVLEMKEYEDLMADLAHEIDAHLRAIEELEEESKNIEAIHGALAEFAEDLGRITTMEDAIDKESRREESASQAMQQLVRDHYWMPVDNATRQLHKLLSAELMGTISIPEDEVLRTLYGRSLEEGECAICGRQLDSALRDNIGIGARDMPDSVSRLSLEQLQATVERLNQLELYRGEGKLLHLQTLEQDRLNALQEIYTYEQQIEEVRARHTNRPSGDQERDIERLKSIVKEIGKRKEQIAQAQLDRLEAEVEFLKRQNQINRIRIDPSIQRKAVASRLALDATRGALEDFREVARRRVEMHASEIFRALIDDPGYAGIQIDSDYRVLPVDSAGEVLPIPSAGGQQLVTLALVGGLNASAVHDAPVVMDTPAGRIDRENRRRILQWIESLDQQTILMVHSGEFTPQDISRLNIDVARSYEIEKTSARTSEVHPLWT